MNKESGINYVCSAITALAGVSLENIDLIKSYIFTILGVISFIVSISYTIFKWYRTAKSDGKITKDEIEEGLAELDKTIKDETDKFKKGE